jgi:hypothetical protein
MVNDILAQNEKMARPIVVKEYKGGVKINTYDASSIEALYEHHGVSLGKDSTDIGSKATYDGEWQMPESSAVLGVLGASGFEEDVLALKESNRHLEEEVRRISERHEIFKRVLLELDVEVSGDTSLVEEHFLNPDSEVVVFCNVKERAQLSWTKVLNDRVEERNREQDLLQKHADFRLRRDEARQKLEELQAKKAELMAASSVVDRMEAEKDELVRRKQDLTKEVAELQKRVNDLEFASRPGHARRQAHGLSGSDLETEGPITITDGQEDPLNRSNRLAGCKRTCAVM